MLTIINEDLSLTIVNEGLSLTIVNEGLSVTIVNKGLSLTIVNETTTIHTIFAASTSTSHFNIDQFKNKDKGLKWFIVNQTCLASNWKFGHLKLQGRSILCK